MSVSLEAMLNEPVSCLTAMGDAYTGTLDAVDGAFNILVSNCVRNGQPQGEPRTFIRGDTVVYIGFNKSCLGTPAGAE